MTQMKIPDSASEHKFIGYPKSKDLHNIELEKDSCGTGFIVNYTQEESFEVTRTAITMLIAMDHRGGRNADPETGDGVGVTYSMPHSFFQDTLKVEGITLPERGNYGAGNIFAPQDKKARERCKLQFENICKEEGVEVIHWRHLKVDSSVIGVEARACEPYILQVFVAFADDTSSRDNLERQLYLVRKRATNVYNQDNSHDELCYICSLSSRLIVYKGMLTADQLASYFDDLQQESFKTYLGMMHSRFSTNTFPSWERAQPFRMMSHNGEINTIFGNVAKMHARQGIMKSDIYGEKLKELYPVIETDMSDSARFDNTLEFLYHNGYPLTKALCMMIPEAWQHNPTMSKKRKAMYESFSCVMDPWDGPACVTFTDGRYVGVVIDRNGLRPSRYYVTNDNMVIMASEFGVAEIESSRVIKKDRLQPGKIFLIDTEEHRIIDDQEIKDELINEEDYVNWINTQRILLDDIELQESHRIHMTTEEIARLGMSYGYSEEDKFFIIKPMVETGKEPLGSMGNDVALACLSDQPRTLFDYFKQWFAQVTNPPIDSIRERNIMSVGAFIGPEGNLLRIEDKHNHRLWIKNPVFTPDEFVKIRHINHRGWKCQSIDITYEKSGGVQAMKDALGRIRKEALKATQDGFQIIILSDRKVSKDRMSLSSLMAASTTHNYLVEQHARARSAIIVESGEPREIHHYCMLIGYGVDAIYPYLVWRHAFQMWDNKLLSPKIDSKEKIIEQYRKAVDYGICKVFAKMGISTIDSYKGAQIFEAVGIGTELINDCFGGTTSRIGGVGYEELFKEAYLFHERGFSENLELEELGAGIITLGNYYWRKHGHKHMWDPESVALLQHAVRYNRVESYRQFAERQNQRSTDQCTIRGLLKIKDTGTSIPIEEVEPASEIMKRFATGAMSYGSISLEAHETLAIAMNRIGGKSNTGEGGEIAERYTPMANGDSKRSAIKQVASGRFGVTIEYLTNSNEIQIKMAQGAKPGEGGELPGRKVFGQIAKTRYSTPGIDLVSPPPHHDIYSIEDLAELIYDLKNANPSARISVKLVSKEGVGVIAAGVAKCKADHILISGHDGGTGASPLTSIKHAGLPWELGIAETHQVLVRNNLRTRVVLQTDGQIKTGRDICIAAMLGAEEFGFATSALVAVGCIMMRKCEMNTCPVGVATQDEKLREKFAGSPEHVVRFMNFMAEDLREIMASLGIRKLDDLVGRTDLLESDSSVLNWKSKLIDVSSILGKEMAREQSLCQTCSIAQNHALERVLDQQIKKDCMNAVQQASPITLSYEIKNTDRTTGAMLSHEIAKLYGLKGLPEDTIQLKFDGHAGQSFGAFLSHGVSTTVVGDANDYAGKGLSGGIIAFIPPENRSFKEEDNIIAGSVVLYGATMGKAFFRGRAAERFCIRNSGARVVVEGLGAHGCEYMTGGRVVVLGTVDHNFASGMSGGIAFVWDKERTLEFHLNVKTARKALLDGIDEQEIKSLIQEHLQRTGSHRAKYILDNWNAELQHFVKVVSPEYQSVLDIQRKQVVKEGA